jgi:hypothetical protein
MPRPAPLHLLQPHDQPLPRLELMITRTAAAEAERWPGTRDVYKTRFVTQKKTRMKSYLAVLSVAAAEAEFEADLSLCI